MYALIICEDTRFSELLTVALRQVGLRGVVRQSLPNDAHQIADAAVFLLNVGDCRGALATLRNLRTLTSAPILMLCAPAEEEELLELYQRGATFVATRPYDLRLLAAQALALSRITAALAAVPAPHPLLNPETQSITLPTGVTRLTTLEFRLVAALLSRPGRVIPPEQLVEDVWGYSGDGDRSLVKALVSRVRRKIEPAPQKPIYLVTEAGVGYRFLPPYDDGAVDRESAA